MLSIDEDEPLKAIFIGLDGVGKTSLINRYCWRDFKDDYDPTWSCSFYAKKIEIDGFDYFINIWDTPGKECLINLLKIFIRNSHIIILVFDITQKESFLYLNKLLGLIESQMNLNDVKFVLVGNKVDLFDKEEIKEIDAENFADMLHAKFTLISAKINPMGFEKFLDGVFQDYIRKYHKSRGLPHRRGRK